jgi:cytochrome c oxidase subunit II
VVTANCFDLLHTALNAQPFGRKEKNGGKIMRRQILSPILAGVLLFGAAAPWRAVAQSKTALPLQVIEMSAKKYEYSPNEIHVKQGTHVQLKIRALDRTHGFTIALYPEGTKDKGNPGIVMAGNVEKFKLEENKETIVEFDALRPGIYEFHCTVFCGMGHRGMKGKVIVE